jgi:hypothetical protein
VLVLTRAHIGHLGRDNGSLIVAQLECRDSSGNHGALAGIKMLFGWKGVENNPFPRVTPI